ncbi:hypothetical protein HHUSO_G508 [Huso huso]|uniref:Uncharacterized protein n=1 Tax=Huso huso TaxID=61971 RepID=A0ABR1AAC2_HUSHU
MENTEPDMDEPATPIHNEEKFIIFISCIKQLITWCHCPECGSFDIISYHVVKGCLLTITISCRSCSSQVNCNSQRYIGGTPAGNILLSASILFAGATAEKVLCVLQNMSVAAISAHTFFRHQCHVVLPVVQRLWTTRQMWVLAALQAEKRNLVLGSNCSANSPGHSARFGSYTMVELHANAVIDIQLVQVNIYNFM